MGLTRCLQFKLVSDGSAIPSTGIFPFPLQNGQVPEKKRMRFGWWFGGPDRRSGEVAVALVLGLQITLGKGSFHPQPPWIHVPAVSFSGGYSEDIIQVTKMYQPISPKICIATRKKTRQNQRELQAACVAYGAAECQTLQGSCRCRWSEGFGLSIETPGAYQQKPQKANKNP